VGDTRLRDQGRERDLAGTTPVEGIGMMWQLALDAWPSLATPMPRSAVTSSA
jgi:hypothetical protein